MEPIIYGHSRPLGHAGDRGRELELKRERFMELVRTGSYIFADLETGKVLVLLLAARDAEPAP